MKQQKRFTRRNGITLISLVITIIIMLILASVAISITLDPDGLFSQAQKATEKWGNKVEYTQSEFDEMLGWLPGAVRFEQTTDTDPEKIATKENTGGTGGSGETGGTGGSGETGGTGGSGETSTTYLIQSIEDLVLLSNAVKDPDAPNTYEGKVIEIEAHLSFTDEKSYIDPDATTWGDINGNGTEEKLITELTTGNGFVPIGDYGKTFKGTIEGNGKTIDGLYVQNRTNVGFVGYAENATVKNLNMSNVNLQGSYVGGLIGYSNGTLTLENNSCSGTISGTEIAGGILGYCNNQSDETAKVALTNCINKAGITLGNYNAAGGIIGETYYTSNLDIDGCKNVANIIGSSSAIGGILGYLYSPKEGAINIQNSSNEGTIMGTGGIIGKTSGYSYSYDLTITLDNCSNTGDITSSFTYTGGLVGEFYNIAKTIINDCDNTGKVSGGNYTGGITGRACRKTTISNCSNTGDVTTTLGNTAGIVGYYAQTIEDGLSISKCYNSGNITTTDNSGNYIAGILGYSDTSDRTIISSCYNEGNISGNHNVSGISAYGVKSITNCYNTGAVLGKTNVGGISGQSGTTISKVYNSGVISGTSNVGGIVGSCRTTTMTKAFNLGNITNTSGTTYTGSITGYKSDATITESYYLDGTCENGIYIYDADPDNSGKKSQTDITTLMNAALTSPEWKAGEGGYPVLDFGSTEE